MPLDGITVFALANELSEILSYAKIDKVAEPSRDELVLTVRKNAKNYKLLINVSSNAPRVHFLTENRENPKVPPMFCMLMRKHLVGSLIKSVKTHDFERLIEFELDTYDDLGFKTTKYLIIELLGKFSNIILLNCDRLIIDSLKRVDFESSVRPLQPNIYYDYPPKQDKISILDLEKLPDTRDELLSLVAGLSPLLADSLFSDDLTTYKENIVLLQSQIKENSLKCYLISKDNRPFDFSVLPQSKFECSLQENFSFMLCDFFEKKDKTNALNSTYKELLKVIKNLIKRKKSKIALQEEELLNAKNRDIFKHYGDLIIANLYALTDTKTTEITLIDYFSESLDEITIELDITLTPKQNADKFFAKYAKLKTAEEILTSEIAKAFADVYYLESILEATLRTETLAEIVEIKLELANASFIKPLKTATKAKFSVPHKFISSDGFTIFAGKNNAQNDFLTLKDSAKTDLWFHTQKIHGSHVVLRTQGETTIPEQTLFECAMIAGFYSKARLSSGVPIDYCPISHVKKPRGAKLGMVIFENYNTLYISPEEKSILALKVD